MIAGLKPYPVMKDSGVEWLGKIPDHWEVRRPRYLLREIDERSKTGAETHLSMSQTLGLVPSDRVQSSLTSESYVGGKLCRSNDLVLNRLKAHLGVFALATQDGVISPDYSVFRGISSSVMRYIEQTLRSPACRGDLRIRAKGIVEGFWRLYTDDFFDIRLPVPPVSEQAAIVRYLDHVDRRVRRLVRAKRKLIALLTEQKQAIIHRAVTGGLDPDVPLKDSGVEWLGDVPAHWQLRRLKWVTRLQRGYDLPSDRRIPGPYSVVSSGGVIGTHNESKATAPGVVMGRYGSTDAVFYIEQDFWPHNTSLFVTDFQGNLPKWCYYLLRSISKADHAGKSAVPGVDRKDLFQIVVVVPPADEQLSVVSAIEAASRDLDGVVASANREIDLLTELRTRLTADVVTGKLDVREVAAALPEIDPLAADDEPDTLDVEPDTELDELAGVEAESP
jgi:type I restriction enzyme S subunit